MNSKFECRVIASRVVKNFLRFIGEVKKQKLGMGRGGNFQSTLHHMIMPIYMSMRFLYNCNIFLGNSPALFIFCFIFCLLHDLNALYVWHGLSEN